MAKAKLKKIFREYIKDVYNELQYNQDIQVKDLKTLIANKIKDENPDTEVATGTLNAQTYCAIVNAEGRKNYVKKSNSDKFDMFYYVNPDDKSIVRKLDPNNVPNGIDLFYGDIESNIKEIDNTKNIELDNIYRIVVLNDETLELNMVYTEYGNDNYEVMGVYFGESGGGGIFHKNEDGNITVTDDVGELNSKYDYEVLEKIFQELERLRAEFEKYDEDGDFICISDAGIDFVEDFTQDSGDFRMAFSEDASEDYIYDIQDEWNLNYYLD